MKKMYLDILLGIQMFRFRNLTLDHVDNASVIENNAPDLVQQEQCLFHRDVQTGGDYLQMLHQEVSRAVEDRKGLPVVRFADGEYAFYRQTKGCNGLYQQAKTIGEIKKAIPFHVEALRILSETGKMAPLVFPGNSHLPRKGFFAFFEKSRGDASATMFLEFLLDHKIELTEKNYIPFYVVYAYLVSEAFAKLVDRKKVCIVCSEFNVKSCQDWFRQYSSSPSLSFAEIPDSYVATRWPFIRKEILRTILPDVDLFLSGAGVGTLSVCVDLAQRFSVPAIDAGHVLNMMNARLDKSNGPRLYTVLK